MAITFTRNSFEPLKWNIQYNNCTKTHISADPDPFRW